MRTPIVRPGRRDIVRSGSVDLSYQVVGAGPVVVVLHDRFQSGAAVLERFGAWAEHATLIVVDLPGHGDSGPHPRPAVPMDAAASARVVADALAEIVDGPIAAIVGVGAGAYPAALVTAARKPGSVAALVVTDLAAATDPARPRSDRPAPQWDGTHLLGLFHAVRHRYLYAGPDVSLADRIAADVPRPWDLHGEVADFLEADGWPGETRLEFTLDQLIAALSDLPPDVEVAVLAHPAGCPRHTCEAAAATVAAAVPRVRARSALLELDAVQAPGARGVVRPRLVDLRGDRLVRRVATVRRPDGSTIGVHLRGRGDGPATPLVLLSASPASARTLEPLIDAFATQRYVVALDNPGQGYSDHPMAETTPPPTPALYADILDGVLDELGLDRVAIWSTHTGAAVGVEYASTRPDRVERLVLDGLAMFGPEQIQEFADRGYLHPLRPDPHGAHLVSSWHIRRDMFMFFPWYTADAAHARLDSHPRDAEHLHTEVVEYIRSGPTYQHPYGAALRYDPTAALAALRVPTLACAGPIDPLKEFLPRIKAVQPAVETCMIPGRHEPRAFAESLTVFGQFLDSDRSIEAT